MSENLQPIHERILHEYPYPISKCYEQLIRTRDLLERRDKLRYLFEVTLKYCACLAVSQYLQSGNRDDVADSALGCLDRPSLGHWLNLLSRCVKLDPELISGFRTTVCERAHGRPAMASAYAELRRMSDPHYSGNPGTIAPLAFCEAMVAHRNRSPGHGAPQKDEAEKLVPMLLTAMLEMLEHFAFLRSYPLAHLGEIRADRLRFVHTLTRLAGVSQMTLPDYITTADKALLGWDRSVVVLDASGAVPLVSLHPLVIYSAEETYILQCSDLRGSVEYLCYHNNKSYQADHIFEDFRERFSRFLDISEGRGGAAEAEDIYKNVVTISLLDGKIEPEERAHLDELAGRLRMDPSRARAIEALLMKDVRVSATVLASSPPTETNASRLSALVEEQAEILGRTGREILDCVRNRPDPTQPMRMPELAKSLHSLPSGTFRTTTPQQIARLIVDLQNHGLVPGLVKTSAGYAVVEDHIAFKLTRDRSLKEKIARSAARLVQSGMRVGLDGGSTTLPVAEKIAAAVDSDLLSDLIVVTNSIPVAQLFAQLVERRGWIDSVSPVQVLICGGRIRAVTQAVAEVLDTSTLTRDFLDGILKEIRGLDCCFVGANGLTELEGVTMPTSVELLTKRQFLAAAVDPFVVADVTKFGQRYPVQIDHWQGRFTVLTNKPAEPNTELERVLAMGRSARIRFAEDIDD